MKTKRQSRPHADLIIAWANGYDLEFREFYERDRKGKALYTWKPASPITVIQNPDFVYRAVLPGHKK